MARICPLTQKPTVYLTCLECNDKVCIDIQPEEKPMPKQELKIDVTLYVPIENNGNENAVDMAHDFLLKVCDQFGCDYCSSCVESEIRDVEE